MIVLGKNSSIVEYCPMHTSDDATKQALNFIKVVIEYHNTDEYYVRDIIIID